MIFAVFMLKFSCKLSKLSPPGLLICWFSIWKAKGAITDDEPLAFGIYFSVTLTDWETNFLISALCCDLSFDMNQIE